MNDYTPDRNAPIGVFDSGVGGLTVMREILRNLPKEKIIYFGDTARVPYGSKSKETVVRYSEQILRFLEKQQVKAIVIACNTASALALDSLEKETNLPIIGVVRPGARVAAATTKNGRIGVIATESTISSNLYPEYIRAVRPDITVFGKACPLFVSLVEEGWTDDPITEMVARRYLDELLEKDIDTLIMGCTHYPLLRTLLRRIVGDRVELINPAYETAIALKQMLEEMDLQRLETPPAEGQYRFYTSDAAERFNSFADSILPCTVADTKQIRIEDF